MIEHGILKRRARASAHTLREFGHGWAFKAGLLDSHPEIARIEIEDMESGAVFTVERNALDQFAIRRVLDVHAGEQIILAGRYWHKSGDVGDAPGGPKAQAQQLDFVAALGTAGRVRW